MSLQEKVWWFWLGMISLLVAIMLVPHSNAQLPVGNESINAAPVFFSSSLDIHLNMSQ